MPGRADATILHVDMDAFYAAVEVLDDPSLAGRPLIVGGTAERGVVASCSYEARAFGIRSAMAGAQARRLCPQAVFVPGRFDRYQEISVGIHRIFHEYTPLVEGIALDEAFLDVTGAVRLMGPPPSIGASIRQRIRAQLGLACSVGLATTKFVAKLASEAAKPRPSAAGAIAGPGVFVVAAGEELGFLHPLPIEALWGVGPVTSAKLRRLGLTTVGALSEVSLATLASAVGRAHGQHLHALSHGIDERSVEPDRAVKSVGHEETFATDRYASADLHRELVRMGDAVAARLRHAGVVGRTVTIKVRYGDFTTLTRARTAPRPTDTAHELVAVAGALLEQVDLRPGVRLLGVSVSNLQLAVEGPAEQLSLLADPAARARRPDTGGGADPRRAGGRDPGAPVAAPGSDTDGWLAASDAVQAVRARFGDRSVGPATLLGPAGLRLKRAGDTQWGPSRVPDDDGSGDGTRTAGGEDQRHRRP